MLEVMATLPAQLRHSGSSKFKCSGSGKATYNTSSSSSSSLLDGGGVARGGGGGDSAELKRMRQREPSAANVATTAPSSEFYYFARAKGNDGSSSGSGDEVNSSETVDSGLSSDTEGFTPPPLPRRVNKKASAGGGGVVGGSNGLRPTELDDSQSDVSADSLALNDDAHTDVTSLASSNEGSASPTTNRKKKALPINLLTEIRMKAVKLQHRPVQQQQQQQQAQQQQQQQQSKYHNNQQQQQQQHHHQSVKELGKALDSQLKVRGKSSSVPPPRSRNVILSMPALMTQQLPSLSGSFDPDANQRFHMREYIEVNSSNGNNNNNNKHNQPESPVEDLSFAGLRDILNVEKGQTIRSHKSGTVRGVRNRVRAGITTFLQGKTLKSYAEREHGKVVVYTTSMGVVRQTYQRCLQVQRILGTLLINYEERDVSMNRQVQQELKERMNRNRVVIPQVFVEGQLLGDADAIEKLNESGDLRQILRRYKRVGPETICDSCGGYRYLPCSVCSGSKKSIHRNHFTTEFVALKCITCNEAGLIRCVACTSNSTPA